MDITLALGGGGAKGNAHIGVLRRLEQEGYRIRSIAGTSFGGLVGILYASGCSPAELLDIFEAVDQANLYGRDSDDGPSILGFSGIRKWLDEVVGEKTFDDLHIPCAVIAVDVKSGAEVIITEGNLKDAILSTIALPGIFPIQQLNDLELIDGGVLNPVPVSVARTLSPNLPIVAVILNAPMDTPVRTFAFPVPSLVPRVLADQISRMNFAQSWDIFMRAVEIGSRGVAQYRLELDAPDVVVRPAVHEIEMLDNVIVKDVAQLGEDAVEEILPKLKRAVSWRHRVGKKLFGKH
ncbi:MAG: patatin-like phospholipase family protein [Anaerolineales bacterium]|nr:patatin-like phospholipase family protein [Anaerolineales bacterium]